jgi:hypothetical protein
MHIKLTKNRWTPRVEEVGVDRGDRTRIRQDAMRLVLTTYPYRLPIVVRALLLFLKTPGIPAHHKSPAYLPRV